MNINELPPCHKPGQKPPYGPCPYHGPEVYSLIHHYNKVCFKNYKEAVSVLENKNLLPGEVAFGYYYDKTANCGVNAITAVGSIKSKSPNILFDNSENITTQIDDLKEIVDVNNEKTVAIQNSIDAVKEDIDIVKNFVNDASNIAETITNIHSDIKNINSNINNLNEHDEEILDTLDNHADSIEELYTLISGDSSKGEGQPTILDKVKVLIDEMHKTITSEQNDAHGELVKQVDSSIENINNSILQLNTNIQQEIIDKLKPIQDDIRYVKDDIIDIKAKIDGDSASSVTKEYVDNAIQTLSDDVNVNITNIQKSVNDITTSVEDLSTYTAKERNILKTTLENNISQFESDINKNISDVNDELKRQKTYITSTFDDLKKEFTTEFNKTITEKESELKQSISDLDSYVKKQDSAITSRLSTIESSLETYKVNIECLIDTKLATQNTSLRNYIQTSISDERTYNDGIYAKKSDVPTKLAAGNGIIISNDTISLNIDVNGVLTVNGKKYQLTETYGYGPVPPTPPIDDDNPDWQPFGPCPCHTPVDPSVNDTGDTINL